LLAGSPKPYRSKGRSQTKRDTLALQVACWAKVQQPRPVKEPIPLKKTQLLKAGRMDNRRAKRVSRNKKENIHLGTWNVLTMLQPGKMQEVTEQILQTELQIVALQEIRWKVQGQIKKDKYNFYYSCKEGQTGQLGTEFLTKKEIVKNIMGFEPINEGIYKLRLKGNYHNIKIINIHAPT
jgi:hypothetical protein